MANRPGQLCVLQKGRSLYNQQNFVDTFNWVVSSMKNLKGGSNCKVDWAADDVPEISVTDDLNPNGGGGGDGGGNPVVSITATDVEGGIQLDWTYADGTTDSKFFPSGGGGGEGGSGGGGGGDTGVYVDSLNGLKGDVNLVEEYDSNITFTVENNNIKIGVYYT